MLDVVWSIRSAEVGEIGTKAHLQIDDADSRLSHAGQSPRGGFDGASCSRDVDSRPVEHAPLATKVILHVDHDRRGGRWIDRDRLRLGLDRDDTTSRLLVASHKLTSRLRPERPMIAHAATTCAWSP